MIKDLLWAAVEPHLYITKEQYFAGLEGWEITPHKTNGEVVGAVMVNGPEFHFVTFGTKWSLTRRDISRYLDPILERHGYVATKTPVDDTRQQRFNELIGFVEAGRDEFNIHYALRRGSTKRQANAILGRERT